MYSRVKCSRPYLSQPATHIHGVTKTLEQVITTTLSFNATIDEISKHTIKLI